METITKDTKLKDLIDRYPWLPEALMEKYEAASRFNTPFYRALLKRATVEDVIKRSGLPLEILLEELAALVKEHEG